MDPPPGKKMFRMRHSIPRLFDLTDGTVPVLRRAPPVEFQMREEEGGREVEEGREGGGGGGGEGGRKF
jgi:hypothetical protein